MARTSRKAAVKRSSSRNGRARGTKAASRSGRGTASDAIALLKADHREVEGWFGEFEKARSNAKKSELAQKICKALTAHTTIEEEILYPAFLDATGEKDLHHEAAVEHEGAKKLIAEIEASGPDDDYYDAKVTVLSEMIKHHVKEEEQRGGLFAKARESDMDLAALGEQLQQRKAELTGEASADGDSGSARSRRARVPASLLARNGKGRADRSSRRG
jgi:hemerythrin superfamily protein